MSLFKSYWTVEGISPDARDAALRAANANGEDLGVWLSRLINKVGLAELESAPIAQNNVEDIAQEMAEDDAEDTVEDAMEDIVEISAEIATDEAMDEADDKMSSIERAMQQSRAAR